MHAHPDDETLTSGALLATWAAAGLPVTVVTCTRGERGEVIGAALAHLEGDAAALAAHRETELVAATRALGARQVFLDTLPTPDRAARAADAGSESRAIAPAARSTDAGARYEDSGMAWVGTGQAGAAGDPPPAAFVAAGLDEAAGRLAVLVRERQPDLLVTYEPGGGYGHPDHVRAHAVAMRAVELAADRGWAGAAVEPGRAAGTAAEDDATGAGGPGRTPGPDRSVDPTSAARRGRPWRVPGVLWAVTDPAVLRAGYAALAADPTVRALVDASAAHAARAGRTGSRAVAARQAPLTLPDPAGPLPSVADGRPVDVAVPVAPVLAPVLAALRAHATQVQAVTPLDAEGVVACLALSHRVLAPVLAEETYAWAPGHRAADPVWPVGVRAT